MKKIFGKLSGNEKEYMEEPQIELSKEVRREQKDVEARVVYQYPKGQFRFPLIPDDREVSRPKGKLRVERDTPRQMAEPPPRKRAQVAKDAPQPIKPKTDKKDFSRRPFRPTEIPSPVFGYEKRERRQHDKPVEYELGSFLKNEYINNEVAEFEVYEQNAQKEDEVDRKVNQLESLEQEINDPEVVYDEGIELISARVEIEEEKIDLDFEIEAEIAATLEEVNEVEVLEEIQEVEEIQELEEVQEVEEIQELEEIQEVEDIQELEEAIEFEEFKEIEEIKDTKEIEEDTIDHTFSDPVPTRSPLPFNVLMLKEDRKRWEEKKNQEKAIQTPSLSTHNVSIPIQKEQEPTKEESSQGEIEEDAPYYVFPELSLLTPPVIYDTSGEWLEQRERLLNDTLESFNVRASVVNVTQGPSVTRFEVQPEPGVKVNKITNLSDDIKLSLAAKDIRIEAPIPGKHTVGIEVPNEVSRPVLISEIINSPEFVHSTSPLTAVLGLDISGKPIVTDLRKMPHGLIAGATGSGKSVCINTILISLLYKSRPDELKLLLIDPKMVELAPYNQIPHLVSPVITDVKAATAALKWAVEEMERRYELFAHTGVREINRFNEQCEQHDQHADKLPFIVIIIDELADLMMMAPADVEEAICRIAQKARACGIHLIIATQRPSVDVITGLIKANVPTRIAFSVSSQIDSRTIIDIAGAERLLGRGDMLFLENGSSKPVRLQGTFVSDEEIDQVVAHVRREQSPQYLFQQEELLKKALISEEEDELFFEACEFVVDQGSASTSSLQRRFKIGYNRAARLIDMMEKHGYISENRGSKPRDVLITEEDLQSLQEM